MNRSRRVTFLLIFLIDICLLGSLCFVKLANYYVNDVVSYNEWSVELGNKFETDVSTNFYKKIEFVNFNGLVRKMLGQQEMNGVVKLNNGYLLTTMDQSSDEYLEECAEGVASLGAYLKDRGIKFVYVSTPYTSSKYDPELPAGVEDYGNVNIDTFMLKLEAKGVDAIDFREKMRNDGVDQYSYMYKTDHHWTTRAGLYAYSILEEYIVNQTGCQVDNRISDISNYDVDIYKKWHLGSRGQRTGKYYAGVDDFELITPKFETSIQNSEGLVGRVEEVTRNTTALQNKDYTSRYTYDYVLGDSCGDFVNLDCKNDIKVLLIGDSFSKALNQYLIMGFGEYRFISNDNTEAVTKEYIEEYDPDVVILMYYPQKLAGDSARNSFAFLND